MEDKNLEQIPETEEISQKEIREKPKEKEHGKEPKEEKEKEKEKEETVELKEETHEPPQKKNKNLRGKQSKKEPRVKEERKEPRFKEEKKEKRESPKKESPKRESHERKESKEKVSNVKEIEEEVSKETKEIKMETETLEIEREKEKKNLQLEFSHKEEFSLEASTPKNSAGNNTFSNKSNTQTTSSGNFNNFYGQLPPYFHMNNMMNPNMSLDMNNMDKKGNMGPIIMYAPVLVDPSTINMNMNMKEMNGQNMGMPFQMMSMYPNFPMAYNQSNKK